MSLQARCSAPMGLGRMMTGRRPYTPMYTKTHSTFAMVLVIMFASKAVGRSTSQPSTPCARNALHHSLKFHQAENSHRGNVRRSTAPHARLKPAFHLQGSRSSLLQQTMRLTEYHPAMSLHKARRSITSRGKAGSPDGSGAPGGTS